MTDTPEHEPGHPLAAAIAAERAKVTAALAAVAAVTEQLTGLDTALADLASQVEADQLDLVLLAMAPDTPPVCPDHVPAEWTPDQTVHTETGDDQCQR